MTILFYLMLLSMPILLLCVLGILWSVKTSQYDDIENAADKILFD
ncbi:cbb3-type cytochrome oxidase assembly protein CcoS [Candidatus Lariskella endosymbiont of Hedychridium roseum]